jgi:transposase
MAPSVDLRERVPRAHGRGEGSQRALAARFGVGLGTVNGWLRLARAGRRAPLPSRGGPKPLGGTDPAALAGLVAARNDATLAEYAEMLAERAAGRRFSAAALCRALARLGLVRKKDAPGHRAGPPRHRRRTRGVAGRGRRGGRSGAARLP